MSAEVSPVGCRARSQSRPCNHPQPSRNRQLRSKGRLNTRQAIMVTDFDVQECGSPATSSATSWPSTRRAPTWSGSASLRSRSPSRDPDRPRIRGPEGPARCTRQSRPRAGSDHDPGVRRGLRGRSRGGAGPYAPRAPALGPAGGDLRPERRTEDATRRARRGPPAAPEPFTTRGGLHDRDGRVHGQVGSPGGQAARLGAERQLNLGSRAASPDAARTLVTGLRRRPGPPPDDAAGRGTRSPTAA